MKYLISSCMVFLIESGILYKTVLNSHLFETKLYDHVTKNSFCNGQEIKVFFTIKKQYIPCPHITSLSNCERPKINFYALKNYI